jgi:DNA mismatch repair ATPase MutS
MVTTHDLTLTQFAGGPDSPISNVHFADRLVDGKMVFDYRMRTGVVQHSNALALMRAVGLEV